jgi:hypothetical protein
MLSKMFNPINTEYFRVLFSLNLHVPSGWPRPTTERHEEPSTTQNIVSHEKINFHYGEREKKFSLLVCPALWKRKKFTKPEL